MLNRVGKIDAVLSDDADAFIFGARVVIRKYVQYQGLFLIVVIPPISPAARRREVLRRHLRMRTQENTCCSALTT